MLIAPGIDADNEALADFCRRNGVSRLQRELEALLGGGRSIDLRTYGDPSRYFRDEVRATARPVFDAAA